ncbi:hypothetical protein CT690_24000 [Serratia plymuthica]|uniref:Uncharacterized protein n=1 Tax=Serratia plymuthica TaxID=82996 RepID=A0A318NS38_SERPL|nr:hypothetical protein [Serratia plymuthica]PYD36610.1 hypothetical protein CT690_24000 [Serratia plymuthica]
MKVVSQFTGICALSAIYLVATVGQIGQLQGNALGTVLWMLAAVPGGMWLTAQGLGAIHRALLKFE